jgi:CRISPR-associated protein Csb1
MQKQFDHLIDGSTDVVAVRALEELVSVDGVVFPPTYAHPTEEKTSIYQMNDVGSKKSVVIDSVGSAANRAEDLFLKDAFLSLIPDATLTIQDAEGKPVETIRAFKCTHHIADSLLINSDHRERIVAALKDAFNGNFEPIAKIDPLSCLQGYWASRTDARNRLPRIFSRRIDAYDIDPIRRSAQYEPSFKQDVLIATGVYALAKDFGEKPSLLGFDSAPSVEQLGGVQVREGGSITSTTILNLIALQLLKTTSPERTTLLRRYILALGLIQFVNPSSGYLRQGCLLVRKEGTTPKIQRFFRSGQVDSMDITPESALAYAQAVAHEFGVGEGFHAVVNSQTASKGWKEQKAVGELKQSLKSPPHVDTASGEGKEPKLPNNTKNKR